MTISNFSKLSSLFTKTTKRENKNKSHPTKIQFKLFYHILLLSSNCVNNEILLIIISYHFLKISIYNIKYSLEKEPIIINQKI